MAEAVGDRCGWDGALKMDVYCARAYFAKTRKEIVPDPVHGCWILPQDSPRRVSAMAKYYGDERGITDDADGEPYRWTECPWCQGDLPLIPFGAAQ